MKELRLSEELLMVAVSEKKGTVAWYKVGLVKYGLAGAMLRELMDRGKLKLNGEKIKILNHDPIGDSILDRALDLMKDTEKEKKVQHWVQKLSKREFKTALLQDLLNKGVLRKIEDENTRWRFPGERYRFWYDIPLKQIRKNLHDILVHGKKADEKNLKRIGLVCACRLYGQVFDNSQERMDAKERAKELSEEDKIRKGIRSAVNAKRGNVITSVLSMILFSIKEIF